MKRSRRALRSAIAVSFPFRSWSSRRRRPFGHRRQHFVDLPHATTQRQRRHLKVGVNRDAPILAREQLGHATQLGELAPDAMQVVLRVPALVGRLDGPAVVEDGARHVEQFLVVLHLVGVLEVRPHHPGVGENDVEALDGFFGGHGAASETGPTGGAGCGAGLPAGADSESSLEYSTRAAPRPTDTMPNHRDQCGTFTPKCSGPPAWGCHKMLTRVLITGARPKISGAMYSL